MILYNHEFVERKDVHIDIEDRGYQFGDGVYEVIRVYGGNLFAPDEHLQRLNYSAKEIELPLPYPTAELKEKLVQLVKHNQLINGIVYLQVTRGPSKRNHPVPESVNPVLTAYCSQKERPTDMMANGIKAALLEDIRWLRCDIKSLNLLGNVMLKTKAVKKGCEEAILFRGDIITEGGSSNVFMIKDGTMHTHPANHLILNGITRQVVIKLAEELGIRVVLQPLSKQQLLSADELFITSTTAEITPVISVDTQSVGSGTPGPVTRRLQQAFESLISRP